ncbi:terpene synthase family protein [Streptomyces sp. NPDC059853]|uniref:terpene synthase family protein n=1 Tax=Streptomyces sp. NPDC059853 TaxID=3346973 RepID=UPI003668BEC5
MAFPGPAAPPALPVTARRHPEAARLTRHAQAWAERFELIHGAEDARRLARGAPAELAAAMLPDAPRPEAELAACWMTWTFFLDDAYEEGPGGTTTAWSAVTDTFRPLLAWQPPPPGAPPLFRALGDLMDRLRVLTSPAWRRRFSGHLADGLAAVRREIELRDAGVPPTLAEYRTLRRDTSGFVPTLDILEVCHRAELPRTVYDAPRYQDLLRAAIDTNAWSNDLYSLDKEVACGLVTNLVLILEHERGLTRTDARRTASAMIEERAADLTRALHRLTPGDAPLARCATAVAHLVAGWLEWHARGTDRYTAPAPGCAPVPPARTDPDRLSGPRAPGRAHG